MKLIIGLGNPGKKYEYNRHNAGFLALDFLFGNWKLEIGNSKNNFQSQFWEYQQNDTKIVLAKPQTFMNNSGQAVAEVVNFYKVDVSRDLLVIHDEADLPFGTIRTTNSSSAAGHNGVKDIIEKLGTQDFHRVRIGVESRASRDVMPTEAFVLQNFTDEELEQLKKEVFPKVNEQIEKFIGIK